MPSLATVALPAILLVTPGTALAPRLTPVTVQRAADGDTPITVADSGTRLPLRLLDIDARPIAYSAEPREPDREGFMQFLQEFINLTLQVVGITGSIAILLAAARLWLHDRAIAKRRGDIRICPGCYKVIRQRSASRCPYCRAELTPGPRVEAPSPQAEMGSYQPVRKKPLRRAQPKQPVRKEPLRVEPQISREAEEPIREEPVHQEAAPKEHVREEPIREEPLPVGLEEGEQEEWEREEREREEVAREERGQRRKVFLYTFLAALIVGYLLAAILFFLARL